MSTAAPKSQAIPPAPTGPAARRSGPIGRLGRYAATNTRTVFIAWAVVAVALGFFAPRVETALSGAGWQANGSESVQVARSRPEGVRRPQQHRPDGRGAQLRLRQCARPAFQQTIRQVAAKLKADARVASVSLPQAGTTISRDGHTAIVMAGANADANTMVRAADDLKAPITALGAKDVQVALTGASGMWSDFNEANRSAMMRSEMFSWPVTLGILVLAFGSLVAAGLPLLLTILGLVASAGSLYLLTKVSPISIWAMNFALMFALALGIDYALFIVMRFRGALFGQHENRVDAVEETMDTAGKAVLFSGLTVLISLTAVMLVDSPAFRSMAVGIMLSVIFILAATLTLLPAVLGKLGTKVDNVSLPWVHQGEHRSARFAAWGEYLWRRPWALGLGTVAVLGALAVPVLSLSTGMPSIKVVPKTDTSRQGYELVQTRLRHRRPRRPAGHRPHRRRHPRPRAAGRRPGHRPGHHATDRRLRRRRAAAGRPQRSIRPPSNSARPSTACARRFPPARWSAAHPPRTTTSKPSWPPRPRWSSASSSASGSCCC